MADQYTLTKSHDGKSRVSISVDYRESLQEIAVLITADHRYDFLYDGGRVNWRAVNKTLPTKHAAIQLAKFSLIRHGDESPHDMVWNIPDMITASAVVLARLESLWGTKGIPKMESDSERFCAGVGL